MKATFILARPKSVNETVVVAAVRYGNNRMNFSTGISVQPKYWNKVTRQVKSIKGASHLELNTILDKTKNRITEVFRRYQNDNGMLPSVSELKKLLDKEFDRNQINDDLLGSERITFLPFFEKIIKSSEEGTRLQPNGKTISPNTIKTYNTTIKHLRAFVKEKRRSIDFETMDLDFYNRYVEYLTKSYKLSPNAIGKDIQIIKLVLREALEMKLHNDRSFESKRFRVMREEPDTIYLKKEELQELAELDLHETPEYEVVRDLFLIGCHTGMRYSDFSNIQKEQIESSFKKIRYKQEKTGQLVVLPLKKEVKKLLDKYIDRLEEVNNLPEIKYNSKTNAALKEIGKKCKLLKKTYSFKKTNGGVTEHLTQAKWERLSTHTARRTFATNELKDGTPIPLIMAATGHQTEKAFWKYIRATSEEKATLLEIQWKKRERNVKAV